MTFILDYGTLTGCGFIVFAFLHITLFCCFFLSFHNVWCIVQGVPMKVNSLSRSHTPWSLFPSRWYTLNISFDCFHLDNCVSLFMLMLYTTCEWINLLIKLKLNCQFWILSTWVFIMFCKSERLLADATREVSSANNHVPRSDAWGMSFIKIRNSSGPRTLPWDTPFN